MAMRQDMEEAVSSEAVVTRRRYDRIAALYDSTEWAVERLAFSRWRSRLWSQVPPGRGLEVGVGTGKNMPYYPAGSQIAGVDLSPKMLEQARRHARKSGVKVDLAEMDVEHLDFPDDSFDWAVATFVFCSVPSPIRGLKELGRVVRPPGRVFLLEHVLIDRPLVRNLMDAVNPAIVRITGANINRKTEGNVRTSGLAIEQVRHLAPLGLVKLMVAKPGSGR